MSRIYVIVTLALILLAGSAHGVTMFYDDFSSGTLDQWTEVIGPVTIVGTAPDTCARFDTSLSGMWAQLEEKPPFALDAGSYQLDFLFLADAPAGSVVKFILWEDLPGGGAWGRGVSVDVNTFGGSVDSPWVTSWQAVPFAGTAWTEVTATFTMPQADTDFSIELKGPNAVMLLDNFSISPVCVPEPTSLVLMGCGLAGVAARTLRRRKA